MSIESGVLYVVATPIGNLSDISARALDVLQKVDYIAAEDTRHSKRLLNHYGIHTPMISLHEHNERERIPKLIGDLESGQSIALISDAGTPLISDPGYPLLNASADRALVVSPIPGPCSIVAALSVAGLPTDRFIYEGFLPAKSGARKERLQLLAGESRTLVFLESSHRIRDSLGDMSAVFGGERKAVVARELTKLHEQIHCAALSVMCDWMDADSNRSRGEFVVMVHGSPQAQSADDAEASRVLKVLLAEMPVARAAAIAAKLTGGRKNQLYALALELGVKSIDPNGAD